MKYIYAFLLFFVAPTAVQATEYGPFLCTSGCLLQGPTPDSDTQGFISEVVNRMLSLETGYRMGDIVVICDGTICARYSRAFAGFVLVARGPDPHNPYRNAGTGSSGGSGIVPVGGGTGMGIIGYRPIYRIAYTDTGDGRVAQWVLVGYEPIYGNYRNHER